MQRLILTSLVLLCAGMVLNPAVAIPQASEDLRAQLRARTQTVLSAPLSARIIDLPVEEGQNVKKDERIVAFDCNEQRAARRSLEARRDGAAATLTAQRRLQDLSSGSALEISLARAELSIAEAEIARILAVLEKCEVKAPFDGIITARAAHPHQYIPEGNPLVELTDVKHLEVEMVLPAQWLTWLQTGQVFHITLDATGKKEPGRIHQVIGRVDPVSQTVRVIGILDHEGGGALLPGMSGIVYFPPQKDGSPQPGSPGSISDSS